MNKTIELPNNINDAINDAKQFSLNIKNIKYASTLINKANSFSQATRPKNVGQLSKLFPNFIKDAKENNSEITINSWKDYYNKQKINNYAGKEAINNAIKKIERYLNSFIKTIFNILTKKEKKNNLKNNNTAIKEWVEDLIYYKTFTGLCIQSIILDDIAKEKKVDYKLSTPDKEKKGIDGYIDNKSYSVKPESYKNSSASEKEKIEADYIVYYNIEDKEITYTIENNNTV